MRQLVTRNEVRCRSLAGNKSRVRMREEIQNLMAALFSQQTVCKVNLRSSLGMLITPLMLTGKLLSEIDKFSALFLQCATVKR